MTASVHGTIRSWGGSRNDEGHREYFIQRLVKTTVTTDGPAAVMQASGLSAIGATWNFGTDIDIWAWCTPYLKVSIHQERQGDPNVWWLVEQKFTTARPSNRRCQDVPIEDPLMEPHNISGTFVKYMKEATHDRFGNPLKTTSHEMIRGPQAEFDANRPTVNISKNFASLGLATFSQMVDTVNDAPLWGLAARRIKLSNVAWTRKVYGSCGFYYTRDYSFDINYEGFDRTVLNEGTKALNGQWGDGPTPGTAPVDWVLLPIGGVDPDPDNPTHFSLYRDRQDQPARVILNADGTPWDGVGDAPTISIEYYNESNFLLLGIPTALD